MEINYLLTYLLTYYVDHGPDCVDLAVPDDIDGYPEGTFSSEPVCVITDYMTYQEKIEALNGTMYDYDDVCDNLPDYFDYEYRLQPYCTRLDRLSYIG